MTGSCHSTIYHIDLYDASGYRKLDTVYVAAVAAVVAVYTAAAVVAVVGIVVVVGTAGVFAVFYVQLLPYQV